MVCICNNLIIYLLLLLTINSKRTNPGNVLSPIIQSASTLELRLFTSIIPLLPQEKDDSSVRIKFGPFCVNANHITMIVDSELWRMERYTLRTLPPLKIPLDIIPKGSSGLISSIICDNDFFYIQTSKVILVFPADSRQGFSLSNYAIWNFPLDNFYKCTPLLGFPQQIAKIGDILYIMGHDRGLLKFNLRKSDYPSQSNNFISVNMITILDSEWKLLRKFPFKNPDSGLSKLAITPNNSRIIITDNTMNSYHEFDINLQTETFTYQSNFKRIQSILSPSVNIWNNFLVGVSTSNIEFFDLMNNNTLSKLISLRENYSFVSYGHSAVYNDTLYILGKNSSTESFYPKITIEDLRIIVDRYFHSPVTKELEEEISRDIKETAYQISNPKPDVLYSQWSLLEIKL